MNETATITPPTSEPGPEPGRIRNEPGTETSEITPAFPSEASAPPAPAVADFPLPALDQGTTVRVRRFRLHASREGEVPRREVEEYEAKVDRVGKTGMVYLKKARGGVGVVFPDELTRVPGGE